MPGRIEARLAELGIILPSAPLPVATYVPTVTTGNLVVVSGQLPIHEGKLYWTGKLGVTIDVEEGKLAARQCLLNVLSQLSVACDGDLDRVARVVRLAGYVACTSDFTQHPQVMNGASDLAVEIFGDAGRHARVTIGVPSLPSDSPVEIEGMFEID
jgi:enamine deaminase RidA (YjgF/YER057c/UK114 family)